MLEDIISERLKKRELLEKAGADPYPAKTKRTAPLSIILEKWDSYAKKTSVTVAGRVYAVRGQGALMFLDVKDELGGIQVVFRQDNAADAANFALTRDTLDIGDFVEASGPLTVTKRGEKSVDAKSVRIITKSLRPIPSQHFGLENTEVRLRQRYLDLLMHPELREIFRKKSAFWRHTRDFLSKAGFLEVETPVLESVAGGADARPFTTHHNALDIDLYLRISPELNLKRLLVGGYDKVFEIGRIFRNEGIDDEHLQDFTTMEFYWAYADYSDLMKFVEKLTKHVILKTFGTLQIPWKDQVIDWSVKWPRVDYFTLLSKTWGVNAEKLTVDELYALAKKYNVPVEPNLGRGRLLDYIYKKTVRPHLIQPCFLINPPVDVEPLAKRMTKEPGKVQRMQILAMGSELGKGFSELNDPIDQRSRFEDQMKLREAGDEEAQMMDKDFVEALEYGMPPAAGFAYGERLFAMLTGKPMREAIFFPTLRPKK